MVEVEFDRWSGFLSSGLEQGIFQRTQSQYVHISQILQSMGRSKTNRAAFQACVSLLNSLSEFKNLKYSLGRLSDIDWGTSSGFE